MAPSLAGATAWLNSEPLTLEGLRGRVVLVDFWTFTCINWLRTLPYRRAWAERYGEHGLVLIGAHTPEFGFEHDLDDIRREAAAKGVEYPIAVDNDYEVWRSFDNNYWPALYFLDAEGSIRHHHFGEEGYEESELVIRRLLAETGAEGLEGDLVSLDPDGVEKAADWDTLGSPETYVGYQRAESFASPGGLEPDQRRVYEAPAALGLNDWAFAGDWTVGGQPAEVNAAGGRIVHRFQARDVNLALAPSAKGTPARFRVSLDGEAPGAAHGLDVDEDGTGTLTDGRLYQLIRQRGEIAERTFEIEFLDAAARAYVFTFG